MKFTGSLLRVRLLFAVMGIGLYMQADAQVNAWTWVSGDDSASYGAYGAQGISGSMIKPVRRAGSTLCKDPSGNLWLFGGYGINGYYNDLWKYDPVAAQWTWISGDSIPNQAGSYAAQGTGSPGNMPGARYGQSSWADASGKIWIFGGYGYSGKYSVVYFNDLWCYNPGNNEWTWVCGSYLTGSQGVYGSIGEWTPGNQPGARAFSAAWTDPTGKFWIFGGSNGSGQLQSGTFVAFNDLWEYNPVNNRWIWVSGNNSTNAVGYYAQSGVPGGGQPGAREGATGVADGAGNFWIFGGDGLDGSNNLGDLNDLWEYSDGQWTWVNGSNTIAARGSYGTQGTPAAANMPGARTAPNSWADATGNVWLFGGEGEGSNTPGNYGFLDDLWKYSPVSNQWTWVGGSKTVDQPDVYGSLSVASSKNTPGGRYMSGATTDASGNLCVFGGYNISGYSQNDLWKYNPVTNQWTWTSGDSSLNTVDYYGMQGVSQASARPGKREGQSGWKDAAGNFWIFGGADNYGNLYNDLWKYTPSNGLWTWMSGSSSLNSPGLYATRGVPAAANVPGARFQQSTWVDSSGHFWIFGGTGYDGKNNEGYLNDLWVYNPATGQWTWVRGDTTVNSAGVGGWPDPYAYINKPGGRSGQCVWTDWLGYIWMFGGYGYDLHGNQGYLSDFWMYTPSDSTWGYAFGNTSANTSSVYGTQGVAATANAPGGRTGATGWITGSGSVWNNYNFWIFGGQSSIGNGFNGNALNDLWEFSWNTGEWTWVGGSGSSNSAGSYGTLGVQSSRNMPPARSGHSGWKDKAGNLWIFGGQGPSMITYNDMWRYNPLQNQWTWISGDNYPNDPGTYGTKGVAALTNEPGARWLPSAWTDATGNVWLFGGRNEINNDPYNDLWKFGLSTIIDLPIQQVTLGGTPGNHENLLTWQTIDEINTDSFEVERSIDGSNFSGIGSVAAVGSGNNNYSFTDDQLPPSAEYFYRLKMSDRDGTQTYSQTIVLYATTVSVLNIYPNPTLGSTTLQLKDNSLLNTPARLLSVKGRLVRQYMITAQQQQLDLTGLSNGVYLLQLANGTTLRIIVI
jgi:N-acetylneuraminic acid mutarotase